LTVAGADHERIRTPQDVPIAVREGAPDDGVDPVRQTVRERDLQDAPVLLVRVLALEIVGAPARWA
jgi:hypothetical protein